MNREITQSFIPRFDGPIDQRKEVETFSDLAWLPGKHWNLVTYVKDEKKEYRLVEGHVDSNLRNIANRVDNKDYMSQTFSNAEDITYAEGQALIASSSLVPGKRYRITDYQTINDA